MIEKSDVQEALKKEYMELRKRAKTYGELRQSIKQIYRDECWNGKSNIASIRREYYEEMLQKELDNMEIAPLLEAVGQNA